MLGSHQESIEKNYLSYFCFNGGDNEIDVCPNIKSSARSFVVIIILTINSLPSVVYGAGAALRSSSEF